MRELRWARPSPLVYLRPTPDTLVSIMPQKILLKPTNLPCKQKLGQWDSRILFATPQLRHYYGNRH